VTTARAAVVIAGALAASAGCSDSLDLAPVVDGPVADTDADAFPDLDQILLEAAHSGSGIDLVSQTFTNGAALELSGVPLVDDLVIHMTGRLDASDVAYGRTCAFSVVDGAAPHLFFSRSVKFATLGVAPETRRLGIGFTYHDGSALLIGGIDDGNKPVADIERFDPLTGEFAAVAQVSPRIDAIAAAVGTPGAEDIALIGGADPTDTMAAGFVEGIDLDADPPRVDRTDDNIVSRVGMTATTVADGSVVVIGGNPPGGGPVAETDQITLVAGSLATKQLRGTLAQPRTGHTATSLGDDEGANILVAGGVDETGAPVATAELYKPLEDAYSDLHPTMVVPRSQHRAVLLPDNTVLIVGGVDGSGSAVTTIERFDEDNGFTDTGAVLPPGSGVIGFTATTLPDGRILLAGGRETEGGDPVTASEIVTLDDLDGTVSVVPTDDLAFPRADQMATLMCDGTVWISGGTAAGMPAERYNPPAAGRR
jgi:hypothetical protein